MGVLKYYVKIKHYLRHENKVSENEVLSYYEALTHTHTQIYIYIYNITKTSKKLISILSNLQTHFKHDFQNVDQHTGET